MSGRLSLSRQTQSILRAAGSACSNGSCSRASRRNHHVHFADEVTTLSSPVRKYRPPPPSTRPPPPHPLQVGHVVVRQKREKDKDKDRRRGADRRERHIHHQRHHHRCRRCHKNRNSKKGRPEGFVEKVERVAREKRKVESGVVKKRRKQAVDGNPLAHRKKKRDVDLVVNGGETSHHKDRRRRLKRLKRDGTLVTARRFVANCVALEEDRFSEAIFQPVEARILYKMYLNCRQRVDTAVQGDQFLMEGGKKIAEAKLRRKMVEEEGEIRQLGKMEGERRGGRKKRHALDRFVARELGAQLPDVRRLSRAQLGRAALLALEKRLDRIDAELNQANAYY